MKTLHLTVTAHWFNLIKKGVKTEEYREIKPYWISRLNEKELKAFKHFDLIQFTNGYSKTNIKL